MRPRRLLLIFSLLSLLIPLATPLYAQSFPFQGELEKSGIAVTTKPPEEAVLLFNLPNVYLLPTSPFYPLKTFWENIQLMLREKPEEKVQYLIDLSNQRLSEAFRLIKQGQYQKAQESLMAYQERFTQAESLLTLVTNDEWRARVLNLLGEQVARQELFAQVLKSRELEQLLPLLSGEFWAGEEEFRGGLKLKRID